MDFLFILYSDDYGLRLRSSQNLGEESGQNVFFGISAFCLKVDIEVFEERPQYLMNLSSKYSY